MNKTYVILIPNGGYIVSYLIDLYLDIFELSTNFERSNKVSVWFYFCLGCSFKKINLVVVIYCLCLR